MRVNRFKKAHKTLSFFRNNFGFRPPYQILVDGTFCQIALKQKIRFQEQIPKYLGSEVKLFTTACVLTEVENLGQVLYGSLVVIKQFPLYSCGHGKKPISAAKCLHHLISRKQETEHFIVATQDQSLIQSLKDFSNCPVLTLRRTALTLFKPSSVAKKAVEKKSEEGMMDDEELQELRELKQRILPEESVVQGVQRKKAKRPNPLSCLKKKPKAAVNQSNDTNESEGKKKRQRKRNRSKVPLPIERVIKAYSSTTKQ